MHFLLEALADETGIPERLIENAKILDKHYIPTQYPNGLERGAPTEFYTRTEAEDAIRRAEEIVRFCGDILAR